MSRPRKRRYRVAIIEDHLLQRQRTEELIRAQEHFELVFSGESSQVFVSWLAKVSFERRPHVIILDLLVERQASVDVALVASLLADGHRIVVLSALSSPHLVRKIVRAGVNAIVGKHDTEDDILAAIDAAIRGEEWLTTELAAVIAGDPNRPKLSIQEERALVLYAAGLSLDAVAAAMNLQPLTARQYINRVKSKYTAAGIPTRTRLDLARIAWADGHIEPPTLDYQPQ